jgi:hypothetical protein
MSNQVSTQVISQVSQDKWEYVTPEIKEIGGKKTRQLIGWMNGPLFKFKIEKKMYEGVGLPKEDDYHSSPADCTYVKFLNDESNKSNSQVLDTFNYLSKLDDIHDSDVFKKKHLGKEYNKYEYSPLVKENSKGVQNVKAKYITDRDSGNIVTKFGLVKSVDENGKRVIEKIVVNNYEDVIKEFGDNSTLEFFLKFKKFWGHKSNMKDPKFGITLEVVQVLIENRTLKSSGVKDFLMNDDFIDGCKVTETTSTSSPVEQVFQKPSTEAETVENKDNEEESSESESESESDSDEEEKAPPQKKAVSGKKK